MSLPEALTMQHDLGSYMHIMQLQRPILSLGTQGHHADVCMCSEASQNGDERYISLDMTCLQTCWPNGEAKQPGALADRYEQAGSTSVLHSTSTTALLDKGQQVCRQPRVASPLMLLRQVGQKVAQSILWV